MTIEIKHQVIFLTEKQANHISKEKKLSLFGITKLISACCLAEFDSKLAIHEKNVNQGQNHIKQAFVIVTPKSVAGLIRKSKLSNEFLFKKLFLLGQKLQCQGISIEELSNSIIVEENSQTNLVKQMNIIEQSLLNDKDKSPYLKNICSVKPVVSKPMTVADMYKSLDESTFLQNLHMSNSMRLKLFKGSEKLNQTALNHSFVPYAQTNDNIVSQSMVCFTKKQTKKQDVIQIGSKNILDELKKNEQQEGRLIEQNNDKKQKEKKIFTKGSKQQTEIVISKIKEEDNVSIKQEIEQKEMIKLNCGQVDKKMKQMSAQIKQLKQKIQILSKQQTTNVASPGTNEKKENKKQGTEIKKQTVQTPLTPLKVSVNEPGQVQLLSKNEQPKIESVTSLKAIQSSCQLKPIQNQVIQPNELTIQSSLGRKVCNDVSDKELKATKATIEDDKEERIVRNESPIILKQKKARNFEQTEKMKLLTNRKQKFQKYRKMQDKKKGDRMLEYVCKQHWEVKTNGKEFAKREKEPNIGSKQNKAEEESYKNLQIIWADSNSSNAYVADTLKKEFGERVKLTKFKEVCFEMIEKIDTSLDTKFILICNNSTFLQVLNTTSYPYRNCEHLFVYCMRQEYAYENKHRFSCYQNIKITSCPQEITSIVSQTARSQYQKIKSRLQ